MNATDHANLLSSMKLMKELEDFIICQYSIIALESALLTLPS
jgi:hypothetical protein